MRSRMSGTYSEDLTSSEKAVIADMTVDLGYENIEDLIRKNGCSSVREFLSDFNFTSLRDFFLGYGWYERLEPFRRRNSTDHTGRIPTRSRRAQAA